MLLLHRKNLFAIVLLISFGTACKSPEIQGRIDGAIHSKKIRSHLQFLSDDITEGREPGSRGIDLAAKYIAAQFQGNGLQPAVGDSTYFQNVTLTAMRSTTVLILRGFGRYWNLKPGEHFIAKTKIENPYLSLRNKNVVFMGYGIDAPEFNWNDYEDVDVTGKILLIFVNEPASSSASFFDADTLTYYGRWTYKYEEAARKGADGVILIHTTPMAGYGWNVISNSVGRESFQISPKEDEKLLSLRAWINEEKAREILTAGGYELDDLIQEANSSSFQPIELSLKVSATIRNQLRTIETENVIAKLEGSDPKLKDECIIYTAHYDHLGSKDAGDEDGIYNGAVDNASGTAALIEIAAAFAKTNLKPKRTILFAAVTAEESGLLGSEYLAQNPIFPLSKTAANINTDAINVWGKTKNIVTLGAERSSIQKIVAEVAKEMSVELSPDSRPGQGLFFRSDQFSFVKKGVPAVNIKGGLKFIGKPENWGQDLMNDYVANRYHRVEDEYDPSWSLEGTVQIAQFAFKTGLYLANSDEMPVWNDGEQFKKIREQSINDVTTKK